MGGKARGIFRAFNLSRVSLSLPVNFPDIVMERMDMETEDDD